MDSWANMYIINMCKNQNLKYKPSINRFNIFFLYSSLSSYAAHEAIAKWEYSKSFNQLNENVNPHIESDILLFWNMDSPEAQDVSASEVILPITPDKEVAERPWVGIPSVTAMDSGFNYHLCSFLAGWLCARHLMSLPPIPHLYNRNNKVTLRLWVNLSGIPEAEDSK